LTFYSCYIVLDVNLTIKNDYLRKDDLQSLDFEN